MFRNKMSSYTVSSQTDVTKTSAYTGVSSDAVSILDPVVAPNKAQKLFRNGYKFPLTNPTATSMSSRIPRHGEAVASPNYAPPPSVLSRFGSRLPVTTGAQDVQSKGHVTSSVATGFSVYHRKQLIEEAAVVLDGAISASTTVIQDFVARAFDPDQSTISLPGDAPYIGTITFNGAEGVVEGTINNGGAAGLTVGGADATFLLVHGDCTITQLAGAGDTVLIVIGDLNIEHATAWFAGAGNKFIICTGAITTTDTSTSPNATSYAVGVEDATYGDTSPTGPFQVLAGAAAAAFTFDPVVSYNADECADFYPFDMVIDTVNLPFPGAYTGAAPVFYNFQTTVTDYLEAVTNMRSRFCVQYGVQPVGIVELREDCYYIKTTIMGCEFTTAVAFQLAAGHSPNFGVHTEPHGTQNYMFAMLQTYRVADHRYEAFNAYKAETPAATAGKTMEIDHLGFIVFSATDYTIPALPHYNGCVLIDKECLRSISTVVPATLETDAGGADPYVTTDTIHKSTYRQLETQPVPPAEDATHKTVYMYSPNRNELKYSPWNGRTTNAGGVVVVRNDVRLSRVKTTTVTCVQSKVSGETMDVFMNGSDMLASPSHFVTYKSPEMIHLVIDKVQYVLLVDKTLKVGDYCYKYTYNSTTSVATLLTVDNGIETTQQWTIGAGDDVTVIVTLIVLFGDTLHPVAEFNLAALLLEDLFIKLFDKVEHHAPLKLSWGQEVYLPSLSDATKTALAQEGVVEVTGKTHWYVDKVKREEAKFYTEVTLFAIKVLRHPSGATKVFIPLADGDYTNVAAETVTIAECHIDVSALPLHYGSTRYIAVEDANFGPAEVVYSAGAGGDYANFEEARVDLSLDELFRLNETDAGFESKTENGKRKTVVTAAGKMVYHGPDHTKITIHVLPDSL